MILMFKRHFKKWSSSRWFIMRTFSSDVMFAQRSRNASKISVSFHNSVQSSCCKTRRGVSIKVKSRLDGYYFRWWNKILRNFYQMTTFLYLFKNCLHFAKNEVQHELQKQFTYAKPRGWDKKFENDGISGLQIKVKCYCESMVSITSCLKFII